MSKDDRRLRTRRFRSISGLIAVDLPVARYYEKYPLQLAQDFPTEPQDRLWRHISRVLDRADDDGGEDARPVQVEDLASVLAALEADGQLRAGDRRRWARREATRILRARQLGLPEEHPAPLASEEEIRRGRMTVL